MQIVNISQKFDLFNEYWSPRIVGELNDFPCQAGKAKR